MRKYAKVEQYLYIPFNILVVATSENAYYFLFYYMYHITQASHEISQTYW